MLRRTFGPKTPAPEPPPAPEFETVDVTRLQVALDTGSPLFFNLEKRDDHTFEESDAQLVITLGQRVMRIARARVLYYETFPWKAQKFKTPITAEQLAALHNS